MNTESKDVSVKEVELDKKIQFLVDTSRLSGVVIAVGVAILLGSVWFSAYRLSILDEQIAERNKSLEAAIEVQKEAETLANVLEKRTRELESSLRTTGSQLTEVQNELKKLNEEKIAMEQELLDLRFVVGKLKPKSLTIYLAKADQNEVAQNIASDYIELGVPENQIRVVKERVGEPPYATEVRYFNYPGDIELAQSILLRIQRDFDLIFSRISLVEDVRPQGAIEIHFNTSF